MKIQLVGVLMLASSLTIAAPAPRLVVLAPNLVELLYSIDAGDQIVATVEFADYPAAATHINRVGNFQSLQLEKIIAAKPDYVVYWRSGSRAGDIDTLQRLGLKTVGFEPKHLSDIAAMLKELGAISGHVAVANQKAQQVGTRLQALARRYQHTAPVPVFYEIWPEPLTTVGRHDWPAQALALCNANAVPQLSTPYPQINVEVLLQQPPALVIQPTSANEQRAHVDFSRWPALANIPQIRVDADKLHRATLRTLDGVEDLCQQIDAVRTSR